MDRVRPLLAGKYKTNPYIFWFLWSFIIAYTVLVTIWMVIYIQNISIVYTWFKNPGMPGVELTSLRGSFTSIVLRIVIIVHPWVPFIIMSLIAYRSNTVLSFGSLVLLLIGFVLCIFGLVVLGDQYSHCNGQNQFGNICNDPRWCCVHEILINTANSCPNSGVDCATPLTFDDIGPNDTFLGLFWFHFTMTMLQLVFFIAMGIIWRYDPAESLGYNSVPSAPSSTELDIPEEEEEKAPPPPVPVQSALVSSLMPAATFTAPSGRKTHGLRSRGQSKKKE